MLVAVFVWPSSQALAQKKSAIRAMECISAEQTGEDVRLKNRCSEAVSVAFCVRGNLKSTWSCPSKGGADRIRPGGFATAKWVVREGGHLVWGACFAPQNPSGFSGTQYTCR